MSGSPQVSMTWWSSSSWETDAIALVASVLGKDKGKGKGKNSKGETWSAKGKGETWSAKGSSWSWETNNYGKDNKGNKGNKGKGKGRWL